MWMTIIVDSSRTDVEMVVQNLLKLVNVIRVEDVTDVPTVMRDLALVKVRAGDGATRADYRSLIHSVRVS